MKRIQKIFIIIGIFVIILVSGFICINNYMNHLVTQMNHSNILLEEESGAFLDSEDKLPADVQDKDPITDGTARPPVKNEVPSPKSYNNQQINTERPGNKTIANDVQKKISRPIEKKDLVKAGVIILRKLNSEEINYLYKIGKKDNYSREEYSHARDILLNKLSSEDIDTLRELGMKYGKDLNILDHELKS
ncbi:MAG: hypothetical protein ABFD18_01925 [Syntrophomonas sp.]